MIKGAREWLSSSMEWGYLTLSLKFSRNFFLPCSLAFPTLSIANVFEDDNRFSFH